MSQGDPRFPSPRFLTVPFIFWPDGTPEPPEWKEFAASYPGYIVVRATFTPAGAELARLDPEPASEPGHTPWGEEREPRSPETGPRPEALRQAPPRRATRAEAVTDAQQVAGMDLIMSHMPPEALASLIESSQRYRKRYDWHRAQKAAGVADHVAPDARRPLQMLDPVAPAEVAEDTVYKRSASGIRLAQGFVEEPPPTPEPVPEPAKIPDTVARPADVPQAGAPDEAVPGTASGPGAEPPPGLAAAPPTPPPVEAAPEDVRPRGDAKGAFPAGLTTPSEPLEAQARKAAEAENRNAARRSNVARGKKFEADALEALGVPASAKRITTTFKDGSSITIVPDGVKGETLVEAKDVINLSMSKQFRGYKGTTKPIELVVSPNTRSVSEELQRVIRESQGAIRVFDPATGKFSVWKQK